MIGIDLNKDLELTKPRKQTPCISHYPTVTAVKNKQCHLLPMITPAIFMGFMIYRKCGKICWAKHLRFQPYEVFTEILSRCIDHQCLLFTYSYGKTFAVLSKTTKV